MNVIKTATGKTDLPLLSNSLKTPFPLTLDHIPHHYAIQFTVRHRSLSTPSPVPPCQVKAPPYTLSKAPNPGPPPALNPIPNLPTPLPLILKTGFILLHNPVSCFFFSTITSLGSS